MRNHMIEPNDNNTVTPPRLPEAMPLTSFSTPQPPIWSLQGRFGRFNYLAWSILFGLIYFAELFLQKVFHKKIQCKKAELIIL